jgi:hypothetical protein
MPRVSGVGEVSSRTPPMGVGPGGRAAQRCADHGREAVDERGDSTARGGLGVIASVKPGAGGAAPQVRLCVDRQGGSGGPRARANARRDVGSNDRLGGEATVTVLLGVGGKPRIGRGSPMATRYVSMPGTARLWSRRRREQRRGGRGSGEFARVGIPRGGRARACCGRTAGGGGEPAQRPRHKRPMGAGRAARAGGDAEPQRGA